MRTLILGCCLLGGGVGADAQVAEPAAAPASASAEVAPVDEARERARIRQERDQAQAITAAEEVACYQRFAVNDCLQEVRARRRAILAELRRQEVALDDARRRRRGAEQILRSDNKAAGKP